MAANSVATIARPPIIGAWVDQQIGCEGTEQKMKQRFAQLSPLIKEWKFFANPKDFNDFLDYDPKNQIFLIMSGQTAQKIVPATHDRVNIHSMYVFCGNVNEHRRLKSEYEKVKDVMNLEEDVYNRIADELSLLLINIGESYVLSKDKPLARENLEEALRLMRHTLHFKPDHGRIRQAKDLLERLDTWDDI
jgi:hypothetical protein